MLPRIKKYFDSRLQLPQGSTTTDQKRVLHLAAAALMLEVAESDFDFDQAEQDRISEGLQKTLGLNRMETGNLMQLAQAEVDDATCLHSFTSLINENWQESEKLELMEQLWRVALADDHINSHEQHMIRRLAGLLYIPHRQYIAAKKRARDKSADPSA